MMNSCRVCRVNGFFSITAHEIDKRVLYAKRGLPYIPYMFSDVFRHKRHYIPLLAYFRRGM